MVQIRPPQGGSGFWDTVLTPWGGTDGFFHAVGCTLRCGLPGDGSIESLLAPLPPVIGSGASATAGASVGVGAWARRILAPSSSARHAGAAATGVPFRQIAGTRGLAHSFDSHAAQWFGRPVGASTHLGQWQSLVERTASSKLQVPWSAGADATVGHLARIDGKYFFAQFYVGGPRAGELATAFSPSQRQLSAILDLLK